MPEKKPKINKRQRFSNWIILFAIAIMLLATYWVVKSNYAPLFPSKKTSKTEQKVSLSVYDKTTGNPVNVATVASGEKLFFKMSTTFPTHIALLEINQQNQAEIIFRDARIPPGKNRLIEIADEKYIYTNPDVQPKRICLLATASAEELHILLGRVKQGIAENLDDVCVQID